MMAKAIHSARLIGWLIVGWMVIPSGAHAQEPAGPAEYYLTCDPDSLAYIYAHPQQDHYIDATLQHGGHTWTRVRLRIRGDESRTYPKKSLKLKLDGAPFIDGRTTLNFNADYLDQSYLHTVVSSRLLRDSGHPAFAAEHARLYLNGDFLGLYVRVENMDEEFLAARGLDPDGNLYKATLDGASLSIYDDIDYHWEKKTNEGSGRSDLGDLIEGLNTVPDADYYDFARAAFDYEKMVNMLAMNMLLANGSTYYHNYYMYHDVEGSGTWIMMPWDLDRTLSSYSVASAYHRSSNFYQADNPFLERAILTPPTLEAVRQRIDELADTIFNTDYVFPIIDSLAAVLEASVAEDTTDDVPDLAAWRERVEREKGFIQHRVAALRMQFETYPSSFRVERRPDITPDSVTFRWHPASDPQEDALRYTLRLSEDKLFPDEATTVYSDIADTSFTLPQLPPEGLYYWYVSVSDGEHQVDGFDTWNTVMITSAEARPLVINEINYNAPAAADPGDWVEFFNPHDEPVDLSGWYFQDESDAHLYTFPFGATIAAGGYLVLCEDEDRFRAMYGAVEALQGVFSFGLSGSGERIRLYNRFGELVDEVIYDDAAPWPEAAGGGGPTLELTDASLDNSLPESWAASHQAGGTPGWVNDTAMSVTLHEDVPARFSLAPNYPNPFNPSTRIRYHLDEPAYVEVHVYDAAGRWVQTLVQARQPAAIYEVAWQADGLSSGVYVYTLHVDGRFIASHQAVLIR